MAVAIVSWRLFAWCEKLLGVACKLEWFRNEVWRFGWVVRWWLSTWSGERIKPVRRKISRVGEVFYEFWTSIGRKITVDEVAFPRPARDTSAKRLKNNLELRIRIK